MSGSLVDDGATMEAVRRWLEDEPLWRRALAELRASGSAVYLVGGSVRDALRGQPGQDMDVAVQGNAIQLGRWLADRLQGAFFPMDREHDVARIVFPSEAYCHIDLAGLRGRTIMQDLAARDFTINAIGVPLADPLGPLLDPTGGQADLAAGVLRMAYPDAFHDDPVRMLRALRQAAALGLAVHPETWACIQEQATLIAGVSPERIRDELMAMLALPTAEPIQHALESGLLWPILPALDRAQATQGVRWLEALHQRGFAQGAMAPYQARVRDLWQQKLVEGRERGALVALAALLAYAPSQALIGLGSRLRLGAREWNHVKGILACRRAEVWGQGSAETTPLAAHRYYRRHREMGVDGAVLAACRPGAPPELTQVAAFLLWAWFEAYQQVVEPPRLVLGHTLMQELDLQPGPCVGLLLTRLAEAQVEGHIQTGAQALMYAQELLTKERSKGSRV